MLLDQPVYNNIVKVISSCMQYNCVFAALSQYQQKQLFHRNFVLTVPVKSADDLRKRPEGAQPDWSGMLARYADAPFYCSLVS